MKESIEAYIKNESRLQGALIGISIRDANTGKMIYEHMGDTRFLPASNMKLLTAAASLNVLGEKYCFSTELRTDGVIEGGKLKGNLYVVGKGDPTLLPETYQRFAQQLHALGIHFIAGSIIGDDTWYDAVRLSQDVIWNDETFHYASSISALTISPDHRYDAGSVYVKISPGKYGDDAKVTVSPKTAYINVLNTIRTGKKGGEEDVTMIRERNGNTIYLSGEIPEGGEGVEEWLAVWKPTDYALHIFQAALKKQGVLIEGSMCRGQAPDSSTLLYKHHSPALKKLMLPFMKNSNNTIAEILVKEMGRQVYGEGSWEKGLQVLEREMDGIGMNLETMVIRDGSGISHINMIPANEVTKLLYKIQKIDWFNTYLHALPHTVAQEPCMLGTLQGRMENLDVKAKTGTIYGVSTLSGYMHIKKGDNIIFSLLLNHLVDEDEGKEIEDRILNIIASAR